MAKNILMGKLKKFSKKYKNRNLLLPYYRLILILRLGVINIKNIEG